MRVLWWLVGSMALKGWIGRLRDAAWEALVSAMPLGVRCRSGTSLSGCIDLIKMPLIARRRHRHRACHRYVYPVHGSVFLVHRRRGPVSALATSILIQLPDIFGLPSLPPSVCPSPSAELSLWRPAAYSGTVGVKGAATLHARVVFADPHL